MSEPTPVLDFDNIQGDILQGLPKIFQTFIFFTITNQLSFKQNFKNIIPLITTTTQVKADQAAIAAHKARGAKGMLTLTGTNVAFSASGLLALGLSAEDVQSINDASFIGGQLADAPFLNDPLTPAGDPDWDPEFKQPIHGCFNITGDSTQTIEYRRSQIENILAGTFSTVSRVDGAVRPGDKAGHEHFGFQDGLSQPAVIGFRDHDTFEDPVNPGVILIGQLGDNDNGTSNGTPTARPPWAKDSSFLVFRKLKQLVPEFNDFLNKNPILLPGLTPAQGSELLGARLVGRWKSGDPIDKDPLQDNPANASLDNANDFDYSDDPLEVRCPFAAHLRKMNPRNSPATAGGPGLENVRPRRIIRQGIPYGPEVTAEESSSATTMIDRGLLFACYQGSIDRGFHFLQQNWANLDSFPFVQDPTLPKIAGFDPIIGQSVDGTRSMTGSNPQMVSTPLSLPPSFVVSRGGEYFLAPSISALKAKIASV